MARSHNQLDGPGRAENCPNRPIFNPCYTMEKYPWSLLVIAIVIIGAVWASIHYEIKGCEEKGGVAVGYYGSDCYNNETKSFIK